MNILGFNPGHHSSVCLLQDGELKYFIQEERITREKYDAYPFKSFIDILQNFKVNIITFSSPSVTFPADNQNNMGNLSYWYVLASKYNPNTKNFLEGNFTSLHHQAHAAHAFYNSGFKNPISVVVDGVGSIIDNKYWLRETETIFKCSYPAKFEILYKNVTNIEKEISLSRAYERITSNLGWDIDEAGKTMGLAPYGKYNKDIPNFFDNNIFKRDTINSETNLFIDKDSYPQLKLKTDPKEWHYDESKITDLEKDLAWRVQNDTQQIVGDYIEKAIQETGLKQVCCAGGYFLNVITNYYLIKRFPDIEFYFEPIANDAGTAIGAAKLAWHDRTQDTTIRPLKSLYLGKQYSKDKLLEGIKKYT